MERNAAAQERIAGTQERLADSELELAREDREFQQAVYNEIIEPLVGQLTGGYNADEAFGEASEFPDIQRPDFKGMIRRDYFDDLDAIEGGKQRSLAEAAETMTASGLTRSGINTGMQGAIMRGSEADRSLARRDMQRRNEMEDRDAYADRRELTLMRHDDTRSRNSERAGLAVAGANIAAGQQANFNPIQWHRAAGNNYNSATGSYGAGSGTRFNAAQLPGGWDVAGGIAGGLLNAGVGLASGGGLSGIWRGRR